jgi:hypothetical protein
MPTPAFPLVYLKGIEDVIRDGTIGKYAVDVMLAHPEMSNQEVLQEVRRKFPGAHTSKESISWYRSKMTKTLPIKVITTQTSSAQLPLPDLNSALEKVEYI